MKIHGMNGSYREPICGVGVERILCSNCALARDVKAGDENKYELWFKTIFKGHSLWANNEQHIDLLIDWLSGNMARKDSDSYLEILPQWMITNKDKVVEKLKQLKSR